MRELTWAPGSAGVADYMLRPGGPVLTAQAKLLYLTLFSYMGADFTCKPGLESLESGAGLSRRKVQEVIKDLVTAGLVERRFTGRATIYRLYPPWEPLSVDKRRTSVDKRRKSCAQNVDKVPADCGQTDEKCTPCTSDAQDVHLRSAHGALQASGDESRSRDLCTSEVQGVHLRSAPCAPEGTHLSNPLEKPIVPPAAEQRTPADRVWSAVISAAEQLMPRQLVLALKACRPVAVDQVQLTIIPPAVDNQRDRVERNLVWLSDRLSRLTGAPMELILAPGDARAGPEGGAMP